MNPEEVTTGSINEFINAKPKPAATPVPEEEMSAEEMDQFLGLDEGEIGPDPSFNMQAEEVDIDAISQEFDKEAKDNEEFLVGEEKLPTFDNEMGVSKEERFRLKNEFNNRKERRAFLEEAGYEVIPVPDDEFNFLVRRTPEESFKVVDPSFEFSKVLSAETIRDVITDPFDYIARGELAVGMGTAGAIAGAPFGGVGSVIGGAGGSMVGDVLGKALTNVATRLAGSDEALIPSKEELGESILAGPMEMAGGKLINKGGELVSKASDGAFKMLASSSRGKAAAVRLKAAGGKLKDFAKTYLDEDGSLTNRTLESVKQLSDSGFFQPFGKKGVALSGKSLRKRQLKRMNELWTKDGTGILQQEVKRADDIITKAGQPVELNEQRLFDFIENKFKADDSQEQAAYEVLTKFIDNVDKSPKTLGGLLELKRLAHQAAKLDGADYSKLSAGNKASRRMHLEIANFLKDSTEKIYDEAVKKVNPELAGKLSALNKEFSSLLDLDVILDNSAATAGFLSGVDRFIKTLAPEFGIVTLGALTGSTALGGAGVALGVAKSSPVRMLRASGAELRSGLYNNLQTSKWPRMVSFISQNKDLITSAMAAKGVDELLIDQTMDVLTYGTKSAKEELLGALTSDDRTKSFFHEPTTGLSSEIVGDKGEVRLLDPNETIQFKQEAVEQFEAREIDSIEYASRVEMLNKGIVKMPEAPVEVETDDEEKPQEVEDSYLDEDSQGNESEEEENNLVSQQAENLRNADL